jgi:O-antigen/teichoic acid export membrane protein
VGCTEGAVSVAVSRGSVKNAVSPGPGRHVVQSIAVTTAVMCIGLVSGIVAARGLGVEGRGELAAVIMWPGFVACVAELGLPTAYTYLSASRARSVGDLAHTVLPLVALQSVLQYIVGVPVVFVVLGGYSPGIRATALVFLGVYAPLYLLVRYLGALTLGEGRIGVYNGARVLLAAVYAGGLLVLLLLDAVGVGAFACAYVAGWLVALALLFLRSGPAIRRGLLAPRADFRTARAAWSVGYRTYLGSLAPVDSLQLDVLLTTAILGPTEAGLYFVATSAGAVVRVWGTTLGALSLPRVATAGTKSEAKNVMSFYVRSTMAISGVFAVVLLVFAGPLLSLVYGEQFEPAKALVRTLVVGMLAASLRYVIGDGLRGLDAHARATYAEVFGWLVGGVALLILLPRWGVEGVAVAVSASYLSTLVVMLGISMRLGIRMNHLLVPTLADVSHAIAVVRMSRGQRPRLHLKADSQGSHGRSRG